MRLVFLRVNLLIFGVILLHCFLPQTGFAEVDLKKSPTFQDFSELSLEDLLNQVVVTGSRQEGRLSDSPSTMRVITEEEIRQSPATTLSDLLRMIPGFQSKTWLSQFTNTSIRGMVGASVINERILWMVDGVPVNDIRDGGIWTDITIPLSSIKRIEILSGPGSALYGANAFLGVIHLITKGPEDYLSRNLHGQVMSSYGTFNTSINNLTVADETRGTRWLWSADAGSTMGPGLVRDRNRPMEAKHSTREWGNLRGKYEWGNNKVNLGIRRVFQDYDGADFAIYRLYQWGRDEKWVDWHYAKNRRKNVKDSFIFNFCFDPKSRRENRWRLSPGPGPRGQGPFFHTGIRNVSGGHTRGCLTRCNRPFL